MKGDFFEQIGLTPPPRPKRSTAGTPRARTSSGKTALTCEDCGLYKTCKSPKMPPTGKGQKEILLVAEAPGQTEDEENTQLVGKSGQYLRDIMEELGLDLDRDFWKTNALICRPPDNRTPTPRELQICRVNLMNTVEMYKPKAIILVGEPAFEAYLGHRMVGRLEKIAYGNWIGEIIPDQELGIWVCAIYHPSYLMRQGGKDKVLESTYRSQLRNIIKTVEEKPFPTFDYRKVEITQDPFQAADWLRELLEKAPRWIAFDYETTGKKPHRKGHRIKSISYCDGDVTRAFLYDKVLEHLWTEVLRHPKIGKICHNIQFEDLWSIEILKQPIVGRRWDTMLAAHVLDNRKNVGLKYQTYRRYGVLGYDADIDPFIRTAKQGENPKSANAFNRIDDAPVDKLLTYNGYDSLFSYQMFLDQKEEFALPRNKNLNQGIDFFHESTEWLAWAQQNGIRIDVEALEKAKKQINHRLECIEERIKACDELKRWDRPEPFNFASGPQLSHLLFDILRVKVNSKTRSGAPSTDEEALEEIDLPIVKEILEYRRWSKAGDTYLGQFEREMVDGMLHPHFGIGNVDTYRSSSNDPNFQNIPKRDEQIKKIIRSLIRPSPGNRIVEYDFKSTEVMVAACYNHDPSLIRYLEDKTTDMHRDTAHDLFFLSLKDISKEERQLAKNGYVFPSFYGSFYEGTAPDLWKRMNDKIKESLRANGIKTYSQFEKHVHAVDDLFWNERFPVYTKWKKDTFYEYEKRGFIELFTGFRCLGPMKRTEVINYRIQGSAFHLLLWTFNHVSNDTKDLPRSRIIGQIHDSIVVDVHPDDEPLFDRLVFEYGTQKVKNEWKWLVVPLEIEKERSEIDGNWADMSGCGSLKQEVCVE